MATNDQIPNETIQIPPQSAPQSTQQQGPSGKAIATLVLGIMSLVCCGFFCGIPAIIIGRTETKAIKEGRSPKAGETIAQVGFILGIVGTVLTLLVTIVYIFLIIFGLSLGFLGQLQQGSVNL